MIPTCLECTRINQVSTLSGTLNTIKITAGKVVSHVVVPITE